MSKYNTIFKDLLPNTRVYLLLCSAPGRRCIFAHLPRPWSKGEVTLHGADPGRHCCRHLGSPLFGLVFFFDFFSQSKIFSDLLCLYFTSFLVCTVLYTCRTIFRTALDGYFLCFSIFSTDHHFIETKSIELVCSH